MSVRKRLVTKSGSICSTHQFQPEDIDKLRDQLLTWYDVNKRDLPWRTEISEKTRNEKAYAVWVSEMMLQQTQVATVISYYNRWIERWPTLEHLAAATSEEVKQMWSGLGYYSRATRLHEGAQKVMKELGGVMPDNAESLQKQLPGVGRYTAAAIASIVFGQVTGLVDGNVVRVFSRLKAVGADTTNQVVQDKIWEYANETVHTDRPGDYNQALMELGATVCTPKNPTCGNCPVQNICKAHAQVDRSRLKSAQSLCVVDTNKQTGDIEDVVDGCKLCFGAEDCWDNSLGVCNYPRKAKKKAARREQTLVCIVHTSNPDTGTEYFISQRPPKGLLAGLWEFSCVDLAEERTDSVSKKTILECLRNRLEVKQADILKYESIGEVVHLFSHIHQTYVVYSVELKSQCSATESTQNCTKWVSREEFLQGAISTAMKKVFKTYEAFNSKSRKARKNSAENSGKKQLQLDSFFTKK